MRFGTDQKKAARSRCPSPIDLVDVFSIDLVDVFPACSFRAAN
jgi:hypothetical protein